MTPPPSDEQARWRKIRDIFAIATDAGSSDRHEIVQSLCGDDTSLRLEVEELLALRNQPGLALDRRIIPPKRQKQMLDEAATRYEPGDFIGEHYRIVRFLARGGMGEVYEAADQRNTQSVAVKFVSQRPADNSRADARFLREIHLARKIEHPNVCRVLDLGEHNGDYYCVMELLEGETLSARLMRTGKLSPAEALPIATQICDGLAAAHAAGVFHRDLKPSNIFLTNDRTVIIDFGLAAPLAKDESLTATGAVIGTLAYMAPEQMEQGGGTAQADLYSLGVTLYEMLAGVKPHDAKSPFRLAAQKARESHRTNTASSSTLAMPALWREVISCCLKVDPRDRYQDASAVKQALDRGRPSARFMLNQPRVFVPVAALTIGLIAWTGWTLARRDYIPQAEAARLYSQAYQSMTEASPMRAVKFLEQAVAFDPKFLNARSLLAVAHSETDQADKAKDALLQAIAVKDSRWTLGRGEAKALEAANAAVVRDFPRAADQYRLLAEMPENRDFAMLSRARMLQSAGKFNEATKTLQDAIRAAPTASSVPAARTRLGGLLSRSPKDIGAAVEFAQAESAYQSKGNLEGLCDVWIARALAFSESGNVRPDLERAIALSAKLGNQYQNLEARRRLVIVLEREKDYDGAVALAQQVADEAQRAGMPGLAASAMADHGYALVYQKKFAEALPILRHAIELAERSKSGALMAAIRSRLGEVLTIHRQMDEAVAVMEPAIGWYRKDGGSISLPLILIKWGTTLAASQNRYRDAPAAFIEAHGLAAKHDLKLYQSMALQRLGAYYERIDLRKSVVYYEQAVLLARETVYTTAMLGAGYTWAELGNFDRARKLIEEAEKQVRDKQKPVDQIVLRKGVQAGLGHLHFLQGRCAESIADVQGSGPLQIRAKACAGASAVSLRPEMASLERQIAASKDDPYFVADRSIGLGDLALHIQDWQAAKRHALMGIEASRIMGLRANELENTLVLRGAEARLGNRAEADRLTAEVLKLVKEVGFDDQAKFGGRHDLLYFWNLANRVDALVASKRSAPSVPKQPTL